MKEYLKITNKLLVLFILLTHIGCSSKVTEIEGSLSFIGPAHLTLTNLNTGETNEKTSSIDIGIGVPLPEYHLTVKYGERMEMRFTPPEKYADKKFNVTFKFLEKEYVVSSDPYSFVVTVSDEVLPGIYAVHCSAICETWATDSSCTQTMKVNIK